MQLKRNHSPEAAFEADQRAAGSGCRVFLCPNTSFRNKAKTVTMNKQNTRTGVGTRNSRGSADPLGANSEIGRKLKQYYDELVSDDVPDRFSQLLSQLERAEPLQKKD